MSKAKAARLLNDLCSIPLCAGQVCATEAEVGKQLRLVVDELLAAARQQPANADETSMGRGRWLWVMVTNCSRRRGSNPPTPMRHRHDL